jgi:hypothetical protein
VEDGAFDPAPGGLSINRKRTQRLWRDEGLKRPTPCKRKRRRPEGGAELFRAERPNHVWAPEIFAFHKAGRISNGRLEGTNNKLGVLKRMAFGFVNADNFEARGLLLCPPRPALP